MSSLPENIAPLMAGEIFNFACHPSLACFTECCRELELALTPYDILRLRKALGLTSATFLDLHAVIEFNEDSPCPVVYLGMVDNGRAQCPFVNENGCQVYENRPGACRTYPLGRGASLTAKGKDAIHVLIREPHCLGFAENRPQNLAAWQADQEITLYNKSNDEMLAILNHPALLNGGRMNKKQSTAFILLYNLDSFMEQSSALLLQPDVKKMTDEAMLSYAIDCFIKNHL